VIQDKQAIPGIGWFTYCRDTEGNVFGIMQPDQAAS
jgi:predicted enzyme related to lactoylglutathione lyase